jgi:N-acetylmuramate 1-kinase
VESGKIINLMKSKIVPIAGDASSRRFYRAVFNKKSKIVVFSKKDKYKNLVAYAAVNKFLREKNILAPKLFEYNYEKGIIVIEDFGDLSFYKVLLKEKNKLKTYKKLVNLLSKIQKIKPKNKINSTIGKFHLIEKYSIKNLHKESGLFFKWYLPIFFKKKEVLYIKKKMTKILSKLYCKLNFPNKYLVHRDFHVQNLMKVGKKIGVIDSQDALIGNPAYDLVSLIDDVRIKTSNKLKNKIYDYYLKIHRFESHKFLQDFNILSVQRSLKIIGIFARLYKRDKKPKYLKLIPYTWKILENRLNSEYFLDLKNILDKKIRKEIRKEIILK